MEDAFRTGGLRQRRHLADHDAGSSALLDHRAGADNRIDKIRLWKVLTPVDPGLLVRHPVGCKCNRMSKRTPARPRTDYHILWSV